MVIDFVTTNGDCLFDSALTAPDDASAANRWGNIPSTISLSEAYTFTQEVLEADSTLIYTLSNKVSDPQFRFGTTNVELEGEYSFTVEISDSIHSESFTKTFLLKVIDNPCEPGIDTSKSRTN